MIERLATERFKSVASLGFACRRVNVFIGAPDTGTTNIPEALSPRPCLGSGAPVHVALRLAPDDGFEPLFSRQVVARPRPCRAGNGA